MHRYWHREIKRIHGQQALATPRRRALSAPSAPFLRPFH